MSIDRGYRPSSPLQAVFSVYNGTFNVCLQNSLKRTCSILNFYQNVSYKIVVLVPLFHSRKAEYRFNGSILAAGHRTLYKNSNRI